jgi:hypothetical protein
VDGARTVFSKSAPFRDLFQRITELRADAVPCPSLLPFGAATRGLAALSSAPNALPAFSDRCKVMELHSKEN